MQQHTMQPGNGATFQQPEPDKLGAAPVPVDAAPLSHARVRELLGWNLLQGLPDQRSCA